MMSRQPETPFTRRAISPSTRAARVEQQDALKAIRAMKRLLDYLELKGGQP